jgi:hypothetical protein
MADPPSPPRPRDHQHVNTLISTDAGARSIPAAVSCSTAAEDAETNVSNHNKENTFSPPSATSPSYQMDRADNNNNKNKNDQECKFCNDSPCVLEQGLYEELVLALELLCQCYNHTCICEFWK